MEKTKQMTGLFIGCYQIGGDKPGAPLFMVHLMFNAPDKRVSGSGEITQAINPPLDIHSRLQGNYTYMTVMPRIVHILISLDGYPALVPVMLPNVHLQMVLNEDWKSGTAN